MLFVVIFNLLQKSDVEKEEAAAKKSIKSIEESSPEQEREKKFEPRADDLD